MKAFIFVLVLATEAFLFVLLLATAARADLQYCNLEITTTPIAETHARIRHCDRLTGRIAVQVRTLCRQFPGSAMCYRFTQSADALSHPCGRPLPSVTECCAAGLTVPPPYHCP